MDACLLDCGTHWSGLVWWQGGRRTQGICRWLLSEVCDLFCMAGLNVTSSVWHLFVRGSVSALLMCRCSEAPTLCATHV